MWLKYNVSRLYGIQVQFKAEHSLWNKANSSSRNELSALLSLVQVVYWLIEFVDAIYCRESCALMCKCIMYMLSNSVITTPKIVKRVKLL